MIRAGLIDEAVNKFFEGLGGFIKSLFGGAFDAVSDYIYISEWWLGFVVTLMVCVIIGYFLPFKWVRAALGFIVWTALVAAWVATIVWKHMRDEKKPPLPKLAPRPPPPQQNWPWNQ